MHANDKTYSSNDHTNIDAAHNEYIFPLIPNELKYLIEPDIHFGKNYQFDGAVQWFVENAEESKFETLAALAERVRLSGDYPYMLRWTVARDRIGQQRNPQTDPQPKNCKQRPKSAARIAFHRGGYEIGRSEGGDRRLECFDYSVFSVSVENFTKKAVLEFVGVPIRGWGPVSA